MVMCNNGTVDAGEFCLPDEFLSDDFFLEKPRGDVLTPSSPVDSMAGTESETEDELIAVATEQMAHSLRIEHSNVNNSRHSAFARDKPKGSVMGTSPQSTLCGVGSWPFGSSNGSPVGPSQVSSPPSTPLPAHRDDALDILYAAAGQVARFGHGNEIYYGRAQYHHPPISNGNNMNLHSNRALIQQQLQAARFYELRRQQLIQQQLAARLRSEEEMGPLGLSRSAWPPLQKGAQAHSHAPAHFLNGGRRESKGTGVFLPQRAGTQTGPKRKPTVVLPARVVQALNLNLDDVTVHPRDDGSFFGRRTAMPAQGKRNPHCPQRAVAAAHDVLLPSEWAY